jgi:hypothetical protein
MAHDDYVLQTVTDGCKIVIGHHVVQEALPVDQEMVEDLRGTALVRDGMAVPYQVQHHFGGTQLKRKISQTLTGFPGRNTLQCRD